MTRLHLALSFLFIFSLVFVSAVGIDNRNLPIVKPDDINFDPNITVNVSVDSADKWNTDDHGELESASDLLHRWLGGLQGGDTGEYYHLNQSVYDYLVANVFDFLTGNIFDQNLNTTENVSFVRVTSNWVQADQVNATVGNFTDLYVSNETLYIGDVKMQSNNNTLNVSGVGGGVTVVASDFFEGDGSRLRNINLSAVNQTAVFEQDVTIEGDLIVNGTTTSLGDVNISGTLDMKNNSIINVHNISANIFSGGNFYGIYDWLAEQPALVFNGTYLYLNMSFLNDSITAQTNTQLSNYYNTTEIDDNFISFDNESDLNVNSSDYWDNLNSINATVLENNAGLLNIVMSFFYTLFYTKEEVNNSFISNTGYNFLNGTLNVTNIYADNLDVLNLTARQINAINITADTIDAVNMTVQDLSAATIFARNFTVNGTPEGFCLSDGTGCENITPNINGIAPWIITNGGNISFNETYLNSTISDISEVQQTYTSTIVTSTGGTGSGVSNSLSFVIKEIQVVPTNPTDQYRFEAIETTNGNIVDKNRKLHTGTWRIEKDYIIDDSLNFSITSANPDSNYNITIKTLSQNI
jgi:hypothetical protein